MEQRMKCPHCGRCIGFVQSTDDEKNTIFSIREKSLDKTFILALDNDEAGQIAAKALIEYFDENNINYCTFDNCGYKDANQALVSDKEKFTEEINKIVFPLIKEREHRKARQFDDEME